MKLTSAQLRQIIKEEVTKALGEAKASKPVVGDSMGLSGNPTAAEVVSALSKFPPSTTVTITDFRGEHAYSVNNVAGVRVLKGRAQKVSQTL